MTDYEQSPIPTAQSAFSFAAGPFYHKYTDHPASLHLPSPTSTSTSLDSSPAHTPPGARGSAAKFELQPIHVAYGDDAPEDAHRLLAPVQATHEPMLTLRSTQIRTMLMRCQMLQARIQGLESKTWAGYRDKSINQHYQTMQELTRTARQLADEVQSTELQARCAYWSARACAGMQDFSAAAEHLKRAGLLGISTSLRRDEMTDLHILLQSVELRLGLAEHADDVCGPAEECSMQQRETRCVQKEKKWTVREQFYIRSGGMHLTLKDEACVTPSRTSGFSTISPEDSVALHHPCEDGSDDLTSETVDEKVLHWRKACV